VLDKVSETLYNVQTLKEAKHHTDGWAATVLRRARGSETWNVCGVLEVRLVATDLAK